MNFEQDPEQALWDWTQRLDRLGLTGAPSELAELLRAAPADADPELVELLRQVVELNAATRGRAAPYAAAGRAA